MDKKLLTTAEVCQLTGLGRSTVYVLFAQNELRSLKIGRSRRVPMTEVDSWIRQKLAAQEADNQQDTASSQGQNRGEK